MKIPGWMHDRFVQIQGNVSCGHGNGEIELVIEHMLEIPEDIPGDIIECGIFAGGSTCKLSIVAKHLGRRLIACDSFMGLPEPEEHDKYHLWHWGGYVRDVTYRKGAFACGFDQVVDSLQKWGELEVVELIPGWFDKTLPNWHRQLCFVLLDVDLIESIRICLKYLWPWLQPGCRFYTHEAVHDLTADLFQDEAFWRDTFGHSSPAFYANHPRAMAPLIPWGLVGFGYAEKGNS